MLTETVTQTKHCKEVVFSIESRPAAVMRYNGALQIMLILFVFHFITWFPPFLVWLPSYRLLEVVRSWVHACVLSLVWLSATPRTVCSPLGSSVHGISQTRTRVGCHFLLQGIFLTERSNLSLLHWQENSLPLSLLDNGSFSLIKKF